METKYSKWVEKNYPNPKNKCAEASSAMSIYFNDLTLQVGYYGGVEHCWCVDEEGVIVDPTKEQFEDQNLEYILVSDRFLERQ